MFNVFSLLSLSVPARLLDAFRVVCVSPSTPGNVGMIARAVANFEAGGLTLVAPAYDRDDPECAAFEHRLATQAEGLRVLREALVCATLAEALDGCAAAVGFTRRRGVVRSASSIDVSLGQIAYLARGSGGAGASGMAEPAGGPVALVFGREADGLTTAELLQCGYTCEILTSAQHGSLNLAMAVTLALGRAFADACAASESGTSEGQTRASHPLGADRTNSRAARLRPASSGSRANAGGAGSAGGAGGAGCSAVSSLQPPSLQRASGSEVDVLVARCLSLAYRGGGQPAGQSAGKLAAHGEAFDMAGEDGGGEEGGGEQGARGGGGSGRVASGGGWVRTARGSRPTSAADRSSATLRRVLQRAQVTGKELRAMHGVLRQVERQLNGGEFFNG